MSHPENMLFQVGAKFEDYEENLSIIKDLLLQCDGPTRKKLCEIYGFKLQMDGDDFTISHDGQRIGSGQILLDGNSNSIEVYPKNTGLKLNELFTFIGEGLNKNYGKVHKLGHQGAESNVSEYTFSFLLGLLNEISSFGVQFFNTYSTRKLVITKGKPIGRVVPKAFVKNQLLGRFDEFQCEILDNSQLRLYATVFYHTAISINQELRGLLASKAFKGVDVQLLTQLATSRLKPYIVDGFSRQMLNRLSKPPYPFGVKELFSYCLKYWTEKGEFSAADTAHKMSFSGFSIRLDYLFEDYVGLVFEDIFNEHVKHIQKKRYGYTEHLDENRMLEPDHIFVDNLNKKLLVVEVKYSNAVAVREHVAQLLAYLDYKYEDWQDYNKTGIVVYPGDMPSCEKIDAFSHNVWIAKVTSNLKESSSVITYKLL